MNFDNQEKIKIQIRISTECLLLLYHCKVSEIMLNHCKLGTICILSCFDMTKIKSCGLTVYMIRETLVSHDCVTAICSASNSKVVDDVNAAINNTQRNEWCTDKIIYGH